MIPHIYSRPEVENMGRAGHKVVDWSSDLRLVRVLDRFEMFVDSTESSVAPHLIEDGFWESWITAWLMNRVDDKTMFIDIGAHTGYYSFLAASLGAVSLAFEPNPKYYKMINSTIRRGHWKNVFTYPLGLSNYTGVASLYVPTELTGSASLSDIEGYETEKVPVTVNRLDDVIHYRSDYSQTIIKIDAEGEEQRILEGARDFLDNTPNTTVLLEYTPGAYSDDFVDELFSNYSVNWVNHDGLTMATTPSWVRAQTDWVMLVLRRA